MAIYKNDVRINLDEPPFSANKKKLEELKFPVRVKLPERAYVTRSTNPNIKERPSQTVISFECLVNDPKEGSIKYNYSALPPVKKDGNWKYYQNGDDGALFIQSVYDIQRNQIDLLYFLMFISPDVEGSAYCKTPSVVIENTFAEASRRNAAREQKAQVYSAIFGENKVPQAEICRIAQAFGVPAVEALTDEEVRDQLFSAVEKRENDITKRDGFKTFLEFFDNKARVELLSMLQEAKDKEYIKFDARSNKWYIHDENGKKAEELCGLLSGKTRDESLEHVATTKPPIAAKIKERILSAQLVAS